MSFQNPLRAQCEYFLQANQQLTGVAGQPVSFVLQDIGGSPMISPSQPSSSITWQWNFGDFSSVNNTPRGTRSDVRTALNMNHIYSTPGTYIARLNITEDCGALFFNGVEVPYNPSTHPYRYTIEFQVTIACAPIVPCPALDASFTIMDFCRIGNSFRLYLNPRPSGPNISHAFVAFTDCNPSQPGAPLNNISNNTIYDIDYIANAGRCILIKHTVYYGNNCSATAYMNYTVPANIPRANAAFIAGLPSAIDPRTNTYRQTFAVNYPAQLHQNWQIFSCIGNQCNTDVTNQLTIIGSGTSFNSVITVTNFQQGVKYQIVHVAVLPMGTCSMDTVKHFVQNGVFSLVGQIANQQMVQKTPIGTLNIAPNPLSSQTRISYNISETNQSAKIIIYDGIGKLIKQFELKENNGEITFQSLNLPQGVYICSLVDGDGKVLESKKMTLTQN